MTPEEIVQHLGGGKPDGHGGWMCRCPSHEDRKPSLHVSGRNDLVLLNCFAKCPPERVVYAVRLEMSDLFYGERANGNGSNGFVAVYDYVDEEGRLLRQVCRKPDKEFPQRRPENGGFVWGVEGVRNVPYRLPQVLQAVKDAKQIWIAEGEKDVEALEKAGVVATCNCGGVGKWRAECADAVAGARAVTIVADRDEQGYAHAHDVYASLVGRVEHLRIVEAVEGKDPFDHLKAGHTLRDFVPVDVAAAVEKESTPCEAPTLLEHARAREPFEHSTTREPDSERKQAHGVVSLSAARDNLFEVVEDNFPDVVDETTACLATAGTLLLEDQQNPAALNFEGVPSSAKTTMIDFFEQAGDKTYRSDKFTPKSLVSHAASVKRDDLDDIDMLPRIRHKVFLIPELAPLFGVRAEDLLENASILTRLFDGRGLTTDSGVHGQRGHVGDYLFAWIGCTTPIEHRVWKTLGKLGSRWCFMEIPSEEQSPEKLWEDVAGGDSYRDRVEACAVVVAKFLDALWDDTGGVRGVAWNRGNDPRDLMLRIAEYAKALARLRGTITVWREGSGDSEIYNFSTPVIEDPHRAMSLLYAFARGHALVHGRRQLTEDDLPIVARLAIESTPNDRRAVMRMLLDNGGTATTSNVEEALHCSAPTARAILETLDKLGVGEYDVLPGISGVLTLADSLRWMLPAAESLKSLKRKTTPCAC